MVNEVAATRRVIHSQGHPAKSSRVADEEFKDLILESMTHAVMMTKKMDKIIEDILRGLQQIFDE